METKPRIPPLASAFARLINPFNRLFDWLYHSKYNPLYRSGTLAVGFLVLLLVTGTYLLFFYSVSDPYRSLGELQAQSWFGHWIRSIHRYATDAALVAVVIHILQLLSQGKSWGPRLMAWVSGVVLLGVMFLSAWSGYVMVWDRHAQALALAGADLLTLFPFLKEVLTQAFNGSTPANASFFFMNLFLHVALPVGMIFGLWVHTARLSRSVWFPIRPIFIYSIASIILLSILVPAKLSPGAELLHVVDQVNYDWFAGFWLPLWHYNGAWSVALLWILIALTLLTIPWWWRPSKSDLRPKSLVDEHLCSGCTQCVSDCPYEAITMQPRPDGKRLLAKVAAQNCVSCGICAASCDDLAIGPPLRNGQDQLADAKRYLLKLRADSKSDIIVITCVSNGFVEGQIRNFASMNPNIHTYPVECCGALHSQVLELLLDHVGGVFLLGCPARNCLNRDGLVLLSGRIFEKRVPFLARRIDRARLCIAANSDAESDQFIGELKDFSDRIKNQATLQFPTTRYWQIIRGTIATIVLLWVLSQLSYLQFGEPADYSLFRLGARVPSQVSKNCRVATPEELAGLPIHMRKPNICDTKLLDYKLTATVDGVQRLQNDVLHSGLRGEKPILVTDEVRVVPGEHNVIVTLVPIDPDLRSEFGLQFQDRIEFEAGRIYLLNYDSSTRKFGLVR